MLANLHIDFDTVVINIKGRKKRLKSVLNQLQLLKISSRVIRAITPDDIDKEILLRQRNKTSGNFHANTKLVFEHENFMNISKAQVGCLESHVQILLDIANSNSSKIVLILEDDAIFKPQFLNQCQEIFNTIPNSWQILHIGYRPIPKIPCLKRNLNSSRIYCQIRGGVVARTHGYFVNGSNAAQKLLKTLNTPTPNVIDLILHRATREYYISLPNLADQNTDFLSDTKFFSKNQLNKTQL